MNTSSGPAAAGPLPATAERPPVQVAHVQDCIAIYRGLDRELCLSVIDLFDRDPNKQRGRIRRSADVFYDERTKRSLDLEITGEGPWRDILRKIHPQIEACIAHYLSKSPVLQSFDLQATGYKIQMYPKNEGYFRWHADGVGPAARNRVVAMVLYLNDVEKGGDTEFFHQQIKIAPTAGHLVLFPTGWNYMHCGHVPESGDKYIISTFIKIKD